MENKIKQDGLKKLAEAMFSNEDCDLNKLKEIINCPQAKAKPIAKDFLDNEDTLNSKQEDLILMRDDE